MCDAYFYLVHRFKEKSSLTTLQEYLEHFTSVK